VGEIQNKSLREKVEKEASPRVFVGRLSGGGKGSDMGTFGGRKRSTEKSAITRRRSRRRNERADCSGSGEKACRRCLGKLKEETENAFHASVIMYLHRHRRS